MLRYAVLPTLALMAATAASPARAQEHPPFLPTRDAAVVYKVAGATPDGSAPLEMHMYLKASGGLMRIDAPGQPGYAVMNRTDNHVFVVMEDRHAYIEMSTSDTGGARLFMLDGSMQYVRKGTETILGATCTDWQVTSPDGTGVACITADGVMLRAQGTSSSGESRGALEAVSLNYGPQADSLFLPPAGFTKLDLQQMMQQQKAP